VNPRCYRLPQNRTKSGDWALLREVIEAVRAGIPDAAHTRPDEVFERVLSALRQADAKLLDSPESDQKRTVPSGPTKFVNDITGRFYNRMVKSLDFEF
jgi:hypothetical protein